MTRFLTDEDFNYDILRGVLRLVPDLDVLRVQDVGLMTVDDAIVLVWAAQEGRVVFTHDVSTMIDAAYQRTREGLPMPGVVAVRRLAPLAACIADVVFMAQAGTPLDFQDQVRYIPLQDQVRYIPF